ncbi:MAG: hypothetical protein FWG51_00455 [Firmicutes bacterium]|nr:hypothetical protein [Bacillota bacterium]
MTNYENIEKSSSTLYRQDYRIHYKRRIGKKGGITSVIFNQFIVALVFAALVLCIKFIPGLIDINFYITGIIELDLLGVVVNFFKGLIV